jgi:hypothetical protein
VRIDQPRACRRVCAVEARNCMSNRSALNVTDQLQGDGNRETINVGNALRRMWSKEYLHCLLYTYIIGPISYTVP